MDYNTNDLNSPEYYRNRGIRNADYNRGPQKPGGDYRPAHAEAKTEKTEQRAKPAMPEEIREALKPAKKRYRLKMACIIAAGVVVLGAASSGIILTAQQKNKASQTESNINLEEYAEYASQTIPTYKVLASELEELKIESIPRDEEPIKTGEIYETCKDSIVDVECATASGVAAGSGIIMSENGFILTNHHVIEDGIYVYVVLSSGRIYEASLVGYDEDMDVAVLKIDASHLEPAEFGDSDELEVGDGVFAIGNPTIDSDLRWTLTSGIVSGLRRDMDYPVTLIQTSAEINTGSSGGALINEYGQVVGITTMKLISTKVTVEGLGFALPVSSLKTAVDEIIKNGSYSKPALGIMGYTVSTEMAYLYDLPEGVYVESLQDGAAEAGNELQPGDVITEIDGTEISNMGQLNDAKYRHVIGDVLTMTVCRNGKYTTVKVPLTEFVETDEG